ncbi:formyl peptide receptor-related sequence 4-like [Clytia hemisphaerica]|uniref:formyl peptide receptor-related sequence 4-like n=1 Tax=Clytia hemisphaerica TaxID=252671 RepID=UPI0034D3EB88|eukprot:TCONS_00005260-protein
MNGTSNLTNHSNDETEKHNFTTMQVFSMAAFSVILFLGSLGNLLVIYVYGFTGRRRFRKFEKLMLMLGVVDFIASITNPAYFLYRIASRGVWQLGYVPCKIIPALGPIFTGISLGIILIMAVDRDRAISTPYKNQFHLRTIYKAVFATIVFSVAITVPYIYHIDIVTYGSEPYCLVDGGVEYNVIVVVIFSFSDVIFLLIFTTTTVRIFSKLQSKTTAAENTKSQKQRRQEKNRILKMIFAMGFMFVLCVFPRDLLFIAFSIRRIFPPEIPIGNVIDVNNVLKVLHTSNSCVNVFLYSFLNEKFRVEIIRVVNKSKRIRRSFYDSSFMSSYRSTTSDNHAENEFIVRNKFDEQKQLMNAK